MLLLVFFAAVPLLDPAPPQPAPGPSPGDAAQAASKCPDLRPRLVQRHDSLGLQRLIELPPGRLELAVHREVDGCPIPAVLREGIGGRGGIESRR
jgi:hypothetical protein